MKSHYPNPTDNLFSFCVRVAGYAFAIEYRLCNYSIIVGSKNDNIGYLENKTKNATCKLCEKLNKHYYEENKS